MRFNRLWRIRGEGDGEDGALALDEHGDSFVMRLLRFDHSCHLSKADWASEGDCRVNRRVNSVIVI